MLAAVLPLVFQALSAWILACWNPHALQHRKGGVPDGRPNFGLIIGLSLLIGVGSMFLLMSESKRAKLFS